MQDTNISFCEQEIGCDIKVLGYRILLKAIDIPNKIGSIYVADSYRETTERRQNIGQIIKIGRSAFKDERFKDFECKVGDFVHYSILERDSVYINGKQCFYINDDRIYAVIEEKDIPKFLDARK